MAKPPDNGDTNLVNELSLGSGVDLRFGCHNGAGAPYPHTSLERNPATSPSVIVWITAAGSPGGYFALSGPDAGADLENVFNGVPTPYVWDIQVGEGATLGAAAHVVVMEDGIAGAEQDCTVNGYAVVTP